MSLLILPFLIILTSGTPSQLSLTIYNNNIAMVKDIRSLNFYQGTSTLYFADVSSNMQPATVKFKALQNESSIRVQEQNFQHNVVNAQLILKKYIGKKIQIISQIGNQLKRNTGILLSKDKFYMLGTSTGILSLSNIPAVELPKIPQDFFTVPSLNWKVSSKINATVQCEVAYRTTGLTWSADYSIVVAEGENSGDVGGWVTIDNNSGKQYRNAKLKLIAGQVNTVSPAPKPVYDDMILNSSPPIALPVLIEKSFSDYHLYSLSAPVTLNEGSQKQVELMPRVYGVAVRKYYRIFVNEGTYESANLPVYGFLEFNNSKKQGLGVPMPKGVVRVFKEFQGSLEFMGEDTIQHTPKNQNITLSLGRSFHMVANLTRKSQSQSPMQSTQNLTITCKKQSDPSASTPESSSCQVQIRVAQKPSIFQTYPPSFAGILRVERAERTTILVQVSAGETISLLWDQDAK